MGLPNLLGIPPGPMGWQEFLFNHWQDHLQIIQAIQAQTGQQLIVYDLEGFNPDAASDWLDRHQNAHNDMNGALGLAGQDLEAVDLRNDHEREAWLFTNFEEHQAVRSTLKI